MSYRRIAAVTAVLAASAALVPALASAADAPQPAGFKTFTSSPGSFVYTSKSGSRAAPDIPPGLQLSGVDTSAYGVAITAALVSPNTPLSATFDWGDGTPNTVSTNYSDGSTDTAADHTYAKPGTYTITVTVIDNLGNTYVNTIKAVTAGSDYTAYGPTRVLDTRYGTGAPKAPVKPYSVTQLTFAGNGGIPKGVTAVVLNVTVTEPTAAGDIIVYGDGATRPHTSNLNFIKGQTVPNQVIAPVGADGKVDFYNASTGSTDLIADVAGYFTQTSSSGYSSLLTPDRLVDTRVGTGEPKRPLAGKSSFAVQIAGNDGGKLPSSGITAVALNVTSTASQGAGFLTAYADGASTPVASNVNFTTGQTIANSVITPVGSDGKIRIFNGSTQATQVVVDVVGYYSAASPGAYVPVTPYRLFDTRDPSSRVYGALPNGDYIWDPISAGEPDVTGWVLNATVTEATGSGDLTVSPDSNELADYQNNTEVWPTKPTASTLNWTKGETVPNLVQASTGINGIIDFWNSSSGTIALVVDVFGFYQND